MKRGWVAAAGLSTVLFASSLAWADDKEACLAASEGADRLDDAGKLLELRTRLEICAREVCPTVVRQECVRRFDELKKRIPTLIVRATDAHGADVTEAAVFVDDVKVADSIDGKPIAVDPGPHVVRVRPTNDASKVIKVVAAEGDHYRQVSFSFVTDDAALAAPPPSAHTPPTPPPDSNDSSGSPVKRWIGVGFLGVGVIATVVGVALIPGALDDYSAYKAEGSGIPNCPTSDIPVGTGACHNVDSSGRSLNDRGNALMFPAIVLLTGGTIFAVVGTILFATSFGHGKPAAASLVPAFGPGYAGLSFGTAF